MRLSLYCRYGKLLYRANTPPVPLLDESSVEEMLQAQPDDRQRERKADKDRTPAIYFAVGPTWSGNFVAGAYRDVLSRLLFRFVGLVLPREAFNTIFLVLVMRRCNLA